MIRVECPSCGTRLRGPDDAAGKNIKCPKCGNPIPVPKPEKIYEPEPLAFDDRPPEGAYDIDDFAAPVASPGYSEAEVQGDARKPCPVCGEMIVANAAKCRFCGEVFDAKLKKAKVKSKKKKRQSGDDDDMTTSDIVLTVLCPGIACIASVVYMIQGKGKGIKIFGLAFLMGVLWNVLSLVLQSVNKP